MRDTVFIVYCDRIKRKQSYILSFPYNEQLIDRIRNLPTESRKFHSKDKVWELKASALYELIKS
ncbi:hypothetical protein ACMYMB_23195, partial [Salmonella enterica subsp. enterica serovar Enteritidis]|uniref:hypothetical protein n=1 Tax=Salmonella enterica TaxID=28901 RepID=UPI0039ED09CD